MLIRFTVENFLSFNEETEFNMLAGDIRRHPDHVVKLPNIELLKSAVIYGANGAGKSNLFRALSLFREMVLGGNIDIITHDHYFRHEQNKEQLTTFEVEFIIGKKGYAYGLSYNAGVVKEEWLYLLHYGKKEDELIFERTVNNKGKQTLKLSPKYTKSSKEKLRVEFYQEDVLKNSNLFIHLTKDKKFKEITVAFEWITEAMLIIFPGSKNFNFINTFLKNKDFKTFINETIFSFETGINTLDVQSIPLNVYFGEDNIPEREQVLKDIQSGEILPVGSTCNAIALMENDIPVVKKIISCHVNERGEEAVFELWEESDGTRRLIDFIPLIYFLVTLPVTVIIDEIDQSIHPSLLKDFITKVQQIPNKKGQLIITTHESNLLDLDLFRQDEIWFAEKNKNGESHFYPLSDFNVRPDLDIRKGYLSGRFGAIPFLGNLKDLNWDKYAEKE
ncbi:AAA family ATPase [Chitinophaga agri]|uniref:ATP-binding protein n=1 Tax=Chitinophaga agri TaxID=2703787 RepID=A0A6B9ZC88_9BACT|nr:ATP-binding protein [Chitinophaga agri]QHS59777.1 ATP-binding protein [Chitinophaga agri]